MIAYIDQWGPFVEGLGQKQRQDRLRSLGYLVRFNCGSREPELLQLLTVAETDATALKPAVEALNRLPLATRKAILDAYARLSEAA